MISSRAIKPVFSARMRFSATTGPFDSPVALGTCVCGTRHRHDPERMPRSRDRLQPSRFVPARGIFPGVLSRDPDAPVPGQGRAGTEARATAGTRSRYRDIASWRASSPVRAARRLSSQVNRHPRADLLTASSGRQFPRNKSEITNVDPAVHRHIGMGVVGRIGRCFSERGLY
jgi:hypothetical protein